MKKRLLIFTVILGAIFILLAIVIPVFMIKKIEMFTPLTHEKVFSSQELKEHYGIGDGKNPSDFGYAEYKTVTFTSEPDNLKLTGWYVESKSKKSDETLILLHGHNANRLRTMKYLRLIKNNGLDKRYSVFIPDLRNSGKSEKSRTALGYEFAEDIHSSIMFINKEFGTKKFALWGFSMACMSIPIMFDREDLNSSLIKEEIKINKIIFDSPFSNAYKTISFMADRKGYPGFIVDYSMWIYNIKMNNYVDKMKLSTLYKDIKIPLLILQAKNDPKDFYPILIDEMKNLNNNVVQNIYFEKGDHVKIYQNKKERKKYIRESVSFLNR